MVSSIGLVIIGGGSAVGQRRGGRVGGACLPSEPERDGRQPDALSLIVRGFLISPPDSEGKPSESAGERRESPERSSSTQADEQSDERSVPKQRPRRHFFRLSLFVRPLREPPREPFRDLRGVSLTRSR